jgi:hypothetical protein
MSYESLYSLEKSVIFRETFNSSFNVQNNKYSHAIINATGVKFENGVAKFDGNSGKITYKMISGYSIKFRIYPTITNNIICRLNSTQSISINSSNQIVGTSISSPTYYVNGVNTQNIILNTWNEVVITTATKIMCSDFQIGYNTTYYKGNIDLFEIYNKVLSASEAKLLNQQRLYTPSIELPLLLDFDSTRGVIEDRTGKNVLTTSNVTIQQIGTVKSAYFNGNSHIDLNKPIFDSVCNFTVSLWIKVIPTSDPIIDIFYQNTIYLQINAGGIYLWNSSANIGSSIGIPYKQKWINIFMTYKGSICNLYINGNNILKSSLVRTITSGNLLIGWPGYASHTVKGYIPKVQIFQDAPSNPDLFAPQLYNSQKGQFSL